MIAVCVSGLAREGYKEALEIAKKIFPFDFYYMQWKGYPEPDVPNLFLTDEPVYNYHNITETKTRAMNKNVTAQELDLVLLFSLGLSFLFKF